MRTWPRWTAPLLVALVVFGVGLSAIDARATYGARVTADEPQYLLTAISLGEDLDLDISDEIEDERFRPFHEIQLNQQTIDLDDDGLRISPHDPLLPLLLAMPMRIGGWQLAKATLAGMGAVTAVITLWVARRRFGVDDRIGAIVVGSAFAAPPMAAYSSQVYPEMPAALATVVGFAALTTDRPRLATDATAAATIVALPWLGVKYVPVAATLALWLLALAWIARRREATAVTAVLAVAGVIYLVLHQRIYGGWTVYSTGDHFVDGEFSVVGENANYPGRTRRLLGLLVDRGFGLIPWAPAFALAPAALAALAIQEARHTWLLVSTIAAGYATATWVALTMHGWWWPGRQLVVILPLAIVALAALAERARLVWPIAAGFLVGVVSWLWLAVEASTGRRTLIVDFEGTANPVYRALRYVIPNHRWMSTADAWGTAAWAIVLLAITWWTLRRLTSHASSPRLDHEIARPAEHEVA